MGTLITMKRKIEKFFMACMACRAGITTDPEKEGNIDKACPHLRGWRIIAGGLSYSDAQRKETEHARRNGL